MADVFVSYAREDRARVALLVDLLEREAWSVFWDRDIPPGETWRSHIGAALERARCVVVAWTEHSILSDWVAEEADEARERDILVPVLLDPVRPPRGLRGVQAADLTGWPHQVDPRVSEAFLAAVAKLAGASGSVVAEPPAVRPSTRRVARWGVQPLTLAAMAGAAIFSVAAFLMWPSTKSESPHRETVRGATSEAHPPARESEPSGQVSSPEGMFGDLPSDSSIPMADPSRTKILGISGKVIPLQ